jgi:hypothetical protein
MNLRTKAIAAILTLASVATVHAQAAQAAPLTRAGVIADFQEARAAGQLHRSDWNDELASRAPAGSIQTRKDVIAQYEGAKVARRALPGPLASRNYNPYGAEILKPDVATRAEVKAQVLVARAQGMLQPAGEAAIPMGRSSAARTSVSAAF